MIDVNPQNIGGVIFRTVVSTETGVLCTTFSKNEKKNVCK
jgi:hypothetical protein